MYVCVCVCIIVCLLFPVQPGEHWEFSVSVRWRILAGALLILSLLILCCCSEGGQEDWSISHGSQDLTLSAFYPTLKLGHWVDQTPLWPIPSTYKLHTNSAKLLLVPLLVLCHALWSEPTFNYCPSGLPRHQWPEVWCWMCVLMLSLFVAVSQVIQTPLCFSDQLRDRELWGCMFVWFQIKLLFPPNHSFSHVMGTKVLAQFLRHCKLTYVQ